MRLRGWGRLVLVQVELMMNTSEGASKLYPLRGWMLSAEKEHNLQLLQLLAFLHAALRKLPKDLASAAEDFVGSVGAGSLGTAELQEACRAIEDLAVHGFIRPYFIGIANELGAVSESRPVLYVAGSKGGSRQDLAWAPVAEGGRWSGL